MIETLKTLILDFQETPLETGIRRQTKIEPVPGKATICVGVRRCGKSTYMFQVIKSLLEKGVSRDNILYLNFFDDRLHNLHHEGLGNVIEAYYSLYPEKKGTEKIYCFFDEIQVIPAWEAFIDRVQRTENCEVYITGSSAQLLSKEIATQMRGRALSWELFPFSFKEFLNYKEIDSEGFLSTKKRLIVQKGFQEYWESGGFPEVIGLEHHLRTKIHQDYFQAILYRDLVERHDIPHPNAVLDLAFKLIDNTGSLYSINSLTGYLQSLHHKAPKSAVSTYVDWFEDAYFLFTVSVFDASLSRRKANPKKIYCIDHAFVTSISSNILVNSGHLLENLVYISLRSIFHNIFYYKTKSGREVDFIVQAPNREKMLVQVCETLANEQTRKREVSALLEAMEEQGLSAGVIITRNEEDIITIEGKKIEVMPIWRFLLRQT